MSDAYGNGNMPWQGATPNAGPQDVVTQLQGIVTQLTALVAAINGRVVSGTITLTAGASTVVAQPAVQSLSTIVLTPTNAAAANLLRTDGLFVASKIPGTSFTLTTGTGSAAGTETFAYSINTPT